MGIRYRIRNDLQCTVELWEGTVTLADWIDCLTVQVADPEWPGDRYLSDLRAVKDITSIFDSDLSDVTSLLGIYQDRIAGLRAAVIVDKESQKTNLFSQFMSAVRVTITVWNDLESACAWLQLDRTDAEEAFQQLRRPDNEG